MGAIAEKEGHMNLVECLDKLSQPPHTKGALYIGNITAAKDVINLKRKNIVNVISAVEQESANFDFYPKHNINHLILPCSDSGGQDMIGFFKEAISFIEENLEHSNVLVHCWAGMSRSATLVIAYLMKKNSLPYKQTFKFL